MKKILKYIKKVLKNPYHLISTYQFYFSPPTLIRKRSETPLKKMQHIAAFTPHNSGDALQTILVRDILKHHKLNIDWNLKHVHMEVNDADVQKFNNKAVFITYNTIHHFISCQDREKIQSGLDGTLIDLINNMIQI